MSDKTFQFSSIAPTSFALEAHLAPYAAHSAESRGRRFEEKPPVARTEFQRDRDRIVHSTAFRRLGNHAEAQEVCQEVFVKALQKLDQLRQPECFGGWLRSVAARLSINRAVRRGPAISTVNPACALTVVSAVEPPMNASTSASA